jgi:hypothetical protein
VRKLFARPTSGRCGRALEIAGLGPPATRIEPSSTSAAMMRAKLMERAGDPNPLVTTHCWHHSQTADDPSHTQFVAGVVANQAPTVGAQTVAGAKRLFVSPPVDLSDPRPVAFLAFSPQQPGSEGFFDTRFGKPRHSWTDMRRPVLTATGDGDSTCDPGPEPGSCIGDTPFGLAGAFVHTATMPAQVRHLTDRAVRIAIAERRVTTLIFWDPSWRYKTQNNHDR